MADADVRAAELVRDANAEGLASQSYVARFLDHYRRLQTPLLDPRLRGRNLRDACPRANECWRSESNAALRQPGHLAIPWVGSEYDDHRVLLLANNLRNDGELGDEIKVMAEVHKALEQGERGISQHMGSTFGYGCALYTEAAIHQSRSESGSDAPSSPQALARRRIFTKMALLQTVKCSPCRPRSQDSPNSTMGHNCPELYLGQELELLRPRTVIVMGQAALGRVRTFLGWAVDWKTHGSVIARWGGTIQVASTYHPAWGRHIRGRRVVAELLRTD